MAEEKQTFRCMCCQEDHPLNDAVCWKCLAQYVENMIKSATDPLKEQIKDLHRKLASIKISFSGDC